MLDSFLTAFLRLLTFSHTPPVTRLCALLHDDVGGAVWHDISEGGQCCPGSPESSGHPTILQVSLRTVTLSYSVTWRKFLVDTSASVTALDCGRRDRFHFLPFSHTPLAAYVLRLTRLQADWCASQSLFGEHKRNSLYAFGFSPPLYRRQTELWLLNWGMNRIITPVHFVFCCVWTLSVLKTCASVLWKIILKWSPDRC